MLTNSDVVELTQFVTTSSGRMASVIIFPPHRNQRQRHESTDGRMGSGGDPEDRRYNGLGRGGQKENPWRER